MKILSLPNWFGKYFSLLLYLFVILIVAIGVIDTSGTKHIWKLIGVLLTFTFSYLIFKKVVKRDIPYMGVLSKIGNSYNFSLLLFILCIAIVIIDFIDCGGFPISEAFHVKTVSELVAIRGSIHSDSPLLLVYIYSWNMRAFIPFTLLLLLVEKKKLLFYILLITACVYAFSMMQKSFILSVLFPVIVYTLLKRKILLLLICCLTATTTIISISAIYNKVTQLDAVYSPKHEMGKTENISEVNKVEENIVTSLIGIVRRITIIPGEMVSCWFDVVPAKKPFLYGDGYGLIAKIKGHKFIDYSTELYPVIRPENVKNGLTGSVNAATFMRGYANFGLIGLALSSISLAFFFVLLDIIFRSEKGKYYYVILNLFPILLLSSGNILTILFSGGWMFMILFYALFKDKLQAAN